MKTVKEFLVDEKFIEMFGDDKESFVKFIDTIGEKEVKILQEQTNQIKEHEQTNRIKEEEQTNQIKEREQTNQTKEQTKQKSVSSMERIIVASCNTINNILESLKEMKDDLQDSSDESICDNRTDEEVEKDINEKFV